MYNSLRTVILSQDYLESFIIGIYWNRHRKLYINQYHSPLIYAKKNEKKVNTPRCSANCFEVHLITESKVFILARTISLVPMQNTFLIQSQNSQHAKVVANPLLHTYKTYKTIPKDTSPKGSTAVTVTAVQQQHVNSMIKINANFTYCSYCVLIV